MKSIFVLLICGVFSLSLMAQNPVLNPSFESWPLQLNADHPYDWFGKHLSKSTDAHSGSFAVKGEAKDPFPVQLQSGGVSQPTFGSTTSWAYLNFYCKFIKNGSANIQVDIIAYGYMDSIVAVEGTYNIPASSAYQPISIPILYTGTPNRFNINIVLTGGPTNSYFIIDDVELSNIPIQTATVIEPTVSENPAVHPSPAVNELILHTGDTTLEWVRIYTVTGALLKYVPSPKERSIYVGDMAKGVYVAELKRVNVEPFRVKWIKQ